MSAPTSLQSLVDDAAVLSAEAQAHLADLHGDDRWDADLQAGTLTFTSATGVATACRAQLIGTAAPGPGSWMWGWNNVNGFPDAVLVAAESVRGVEGVSELTTPELPLTDELPYRLALAAKVVNRSWTHYSAPVTGGTRIWFLVEHPSFALPTPSVPRVARSISEAIGTTTVADHRRAVTSYAALRGIPLTDDGASLALTLSDGSLVVGFDDLGRVAKVSGSMGGGAGTGTTAAAQPEPSSDGERRRGWFGRRR